MKDMAARSGVSEGTLRMWEARHHFPQPARLPSGHRRYSELDVLRVRAVAHARRQGLSLPMAIGRAQAIGHDERPSVFGALRDRFPQLTAHTLPKVALVALSQAIEDECTSYGDRAILFGCFQHERFYRQVEPRWREMARTAEFAVVLADFRRKRRRKASPSEVPLRPDDALMREWVVVCESPRFAACLAGFERPGMPGVPRRFETIWTFQAQPVREAARMCCELAARSAPEFVAGLAEQLADPLPPRDELRVAINLTTRMVLYVADGSGGA